jgi:hypothetical protein
MAVIATVRVRPRAASPSPRPDADLLEQAARLLAALGFRVLRVGRFGVSIEGEEETFARELGVRVRQGKGAADRASPTNADLAELIDIVEVAPPPTPLTL